MPPRPNLIPFLLRYHAKIRPVYLTNGTPDYSACWEWIGAKSRSRSRKGKGQIYYGHIKVTTLRCVRVNRLALILDRGEVDAPRDPDEPIEQWIFRCLRYYRSLDLEAAHICDHSLCPNPTHLQWESHLDNITNQKRRQQPGPGCAAELPVLAPAGRPAGSAVI